MNTPIDWRAVAILCAELAGLAAIGYWFSRRQALVKTFVVRQEPICDTRTVFHCSNFACTGTMTGNCSEDVHCPDCGTWYKTGHFEGPRDRGRVSSIAHRLMAQSKCQHIQRQRYQHVNSLVECTKCDATWEA